MSWLSNTFNSAVDYVQNDLVNDVANGTVNATRYVVSGAAFKDITSATIQTKETAIYAYNNPLHASHVALEGVQHGAASATSFVAGAVGGAGGLVADSFNYAVKTAGNQLNQNWELYEGGFGTAASYAFNGANSATNGFIIDSSDFVLSSVGIEDPDILNEHDMIIFGATKGGTEVAAAIAAIAVTGGAASGLYASATGGSFAAAASGSTLSLITGSVGTKTALALTAVGTGYSIHNNIDEQFKIVEREVEMLNKAFGIDEARPALAM